MATPMMDTITLMSLSKNDFFVFIRNLKKYWIFLKFPKKNYRIF